MFEEPKPHKTINEIRPWETISLVVGNCLIIAYIVFKTTGN